MTEYQNDRQGKPGKSSPQEYYYYHDESGTTLFRVVRTADRHFYQQKYVGAPERYEHGTKGVPRILYRLPEVKKADTVWIHEGEKDVESFLELLGPGEAATTNPMGALKWKPEYGFGKHLKGKNVIIVQDKDDIGRQHAQMIVNDLEGKAESVKIISMPGKGVKDFTDWLELNIEGTVSEPGDFPKPGLVAVMRSVLVDMVDRSAELALRPLSESLRKLVMTFSDFLELKLPIRGMLMKPWLEEASYGLIAGKEAGGKTWLAMQIAASLANGKDCMGGLWTVEQPVPVLYVDGEMHWQDIWDRGTMVGLKSGFILSKTYMEAEGTPYDLNLADDYIRDELTKFILEQGYKLVVFDNIFSLVYGIDTNSDSEWSPINQWLLRLRANGVSVILIHHVGKGEKPTQLGTSSRMFNLNWALTLHPRKVMSGDEPCEFKIKIDKKRGLMPGLTGMWFTCKDGNWEVVEEEEKKAEEQKDKLMQVCKMMVEDKMPQKEIAVEMGVSAAAVSQNLSQAVRLNLIRRVGHGEYEWTVEGNERFINRAISN